MKQPELGQQISEIRKQRGYTQSELAEECNVDIRTIQRIETGEVTPRLFTLRIINEKLGTNLDLNGDSGNRKLAGSAKIIRTGWIAGIILVCLVPIMVIEALRLTDFNWMNSKWPLFALLCYVSIHILSVIFFYRSLFFYGKYTRNQILPIGAVITIVIVVIFDMLKITGIIFDLSFMLQINMLSGILFGVSSIIVGVGFVLVKFNNKELAVFIGVTQILAGTFYVFAGIIGVGLGAVSLIMQIVFLIKTEGLLKN